MGDYAIRMQFDIDADTDAVLDALATEQGVASWWSDATSGSPGQHGGEFRVSFPDVPQPFEFAVRRDGEHALAWDTQLFPPWWAGTTIGWDVGDNPEGPGTRLQFVHGGYEPDNPVIPIVTPAWAQIILRLKRYAETGSPNPFFTGPGSRP